MFRELIDKHVLNPEACKKLLDAGFDKKTLFIWRKYSLQKEPEIYLRPQDNTFFATLSGTLEWELPAPLLTEILDCEPEQALEKEVDKFCKQNDTDRISEKDKS